MNDAIALAAHDPAWADAFAAEAGVIAAALGDALVAIHHIGSTAVPGLVAKPVIDILIEVDSLAEIDAATGPLAAIGYAAKGENGIAGRRYFVKRGADGARTHHLHAFAAGARDAIRHIVFRDHLRANPQVAAEYAALKQAIVADGVARRADYVAAKRDWIARIVDGVLADRR